MSNEFFDRATNEKCETDGSGNTSTVSCQSLPPVNENWNVGYDDPSKKKTVVVKIKNGGITDDEIRNARRDFAITDLAERIADNLWEKANPDSPNPPPLSDRPQDGDDTPIDRPSASLPDSGIGNGDASSAGTGGSPVSGGGAASGGGSGGGTGSGGSSMASSETGGGAGSGETIISDTPVTISDQDLMDMIADTLDMTRLARGLMKDDLLAIANTIKNSMAESGLGTIGAGSMTTNISGLSFPNLVSLIVQSTAAGLSNVASTPPSEEESEEEEEGGEEGGAESEEAEDPENKAMEFINDLDFLYQEFEIKPSTPMSPVIEPELPFIFPASLPNSARDEALSKSLSTYLGYLEEVHCSYYPLGNPKISPPGIYSFLDEIDVDIEKVKHMALLTLDAAKSLLKIVPWLFTTNPNRAREANRRARHLKSKIFEAIAMIPSMLDLWDGIGEWTTPYLTLNELDKSQLNIEKWGGYFGGTEFRPRLVRDSVFRKHFTEDRETIQKVYDTTNEFFQYCMGNAYMYAEKVENGTWDEITTYYPTKDLTWVGEKCKGDRYYHLVIQPAASPFPIALKVIGLSKYLVEYIVHQTEITRIETYDLNTRIDQRRVALVDYRGYKRMNKFMRLDRSGLDVINDE